MSGSELPERPALRPVEAFPVVSGGEEYVCLRDPQTLAEAPVFLNRQVAFLVARMDGTRTLRDIQADFARATGHILPMERIEDLVRQLDEGRFLASEAFRRFIADQERIFCESPLRPSRHSGSAYPAAPDELVREMEAYLCSPELPQRDSGSTGRPRLRGLVAPHIDFTRGGSVYASAYRALRDTDASRFVVFGTCHNPMRRRFALTAKDFETPFGTVPNDREFLKCFTERLPNDYFEDEFAHRAEHSIEFQVVWLKHVLGLRRDFTIVPILVGSFQDLLAAGCCPSDDSEVDDVVSAVCAALGESPGASCVIAGADLAHVGRRFGDPSGPTEESLREVGREDAEFLSLVEAGDADGMFRSIAQSQDRRRVCGYPPIYMTLRSMEQPSGTLLDYRQWADFEGGAAVTFAALELR